MYMLLLKTNMKQKLNTTSKLVCVTETRKKTTQHVEDDFEKGMVTGAIFVDLSAVYDTINH